MAARQSRQLERFRYTRRRQRANFKRSWCVYACIEVAGQIEVMCDFNDCNKNKPDRADDNINKTDLDALTKTMMTSYYKDDEDNDRAGPKNTVLRGIFKSSKNTVSLQILQNRTRYISRHNQSISKE